MFAEWDLEVYIACKCIWSVNIIQKANMICFHVFTRKHNYIMFVCPFIGRSEPCLAAWSSPGLGGIALRDGCVSVHRIQGGAGLVGQGCVSIPLQNHRYSINRKYTFAASCSYWEITLFTWTRINTFQCNRSAARHADKYSLNIL